ncbi:MAG: YbjN domain-containing protein [Ilumatobacteraceae bacterium]
MAATRRLPSKTVVASTTTPDNKVSDNKVSDNKVSDDNVPDNTVPDHTAPDPTAPDHTARTTAAASARPVFDAVIAFLVERGYIDANARDDNDDTVVRLDGSGENGAWLLWIASDEDTQRCVVYSTANFMVEPERRTAMLELQSRINVTLAVGNFELDLDNGQTAFRTSIDVEDDRLSEALLTQLVAANVETFDSYLPALEAVAHRGTDPVEALAAIAL